MSRARVGAGGHMCLAVDEGRGSWAHVWTKVVQMWLTRVGWER